MSSEPGGTGADWPPVVVATFPQEGPHGYDELTSHAREKVAGVESFYVLGWSFAGPLALRLACAEPGRVRGVILSATFVRAPRRWLPPLIRVMTPLTLFLFRFVRRLPIWLLRSSSDPFRRAKAEAWDTVPAAALAGRSRSIAKVDARADLCACGAPVIYLASSKDGVVPRHNAEEIARERPDVRCVTIDGGHLAMFTNPDAAARAIVAFLDEQERVRGSCAAKSEAPAPA